MPISFPTRRGRVAALFGLLCLFMSGVSAMVRRDLAAGHAISGYGWIVLVIGPLAILQTVATVWALAVKNRPWCWIADGALHFADSGKLPVPLTDILAVTLRGGPLHRIVITCRGGAKFQIPGYLLAGPPAEAARLLADAAGVPPT